VLNASRSHQDFQEFVTEQLKTHYCQLGLTNTLLLHHRELASVWITDLTKVASIIGDRYSPSRGAPARDPVDLFRSLLLMELVHERSIDVWVKKMNSFPLWAILSGFVPDDVPGVGTFYDFLKRLWLASSAHLSSKVRKTRRKPKKGKKKGDKSPLRKPGVVKRLVDRFLKHPPSFNSRPHDLLQQIFKECFVVPSAKIGLLGNVDNLSIAGDGTSVRTGASRYGKLFCDCRKMKVFNCSCPRKFSDPDASWGWDSYREEYFYGRSLYAFTAADSPYDLPVYLCLHKAQRHDSVAFVYSLFDLLQLYPEFSFSECLLDSAHDAYPIYELLHHFGIAAVIDLNSRNTGHFSCGCDFSFTDQGIPICQAGHIMAYHGFCKDRQRHKWRCPLSRKKWKVSCNTPCSHSSYGRVVYTRELDNLRYFTRIPRGSDLWSVRYKRRTAAERFIKRLKEDYLLEKRGKIRSSRAWSFRVFADAMCLHIDAMLKHLNLDIRSLILRWESEVVAA
jgi:hypothetical protein